LKHSSAKGNYESDLDSDTDSDPIPKIEAIREMSLTEQPLMRLGRTHAHEK
jgi:hypothetical protein